MCSVFGTLTEPSNIRCSNRCAKPVWPVGLVPRPHVVPEVDRHHRRAAVLADHHAQAVVEPGGLDRPGITRLGHGTTLSDSRPGYLPRCTASRTFSTLPPTGCRCSGTPRRRRPARCCSRGRRVEATSSALVALHDDEGIRATVYRHWSDVTRARGGPHPVPRGIRLRGGRAESPPTRWRRRVPAEPGAAAACQRPPDVADDAGQPGEVAETVGAELDGVLFAGDMVGVPDAGRRLVRPPDRARLLRGDDRTGRRARSPAGATGARRCSSTPRSSRRSATTR